MIEFDEWYISDDAPEQPSLPDAYGAGQQAKIDCMQVRIDGANERALSILNHKNVMVDKMQAEIDELQKRADEVLGLFVGYECDGELQIFRKSIRKILEGNKDD